MITIYDIAKICNVAPCTVSKVINNYPNVSEKTRKKILDALETLHYVPNTLAKSLGNGKSNNIGILMYTGERMPFFKQNLYIELLENVRAYLESQNYDLLLINKNVAGKEKNYLDHCYARQIDGLVLFGNMESDEMKSLINSDIPTVGFDYLGDQMSGVSSDNYDKVCELTKHLLNLGHRDIVFICGEDNKITKARISAFKDTINSYGIAFKDEMIVKGKYYDMSLAHDITIDLLSKENRPTAIIYPDDYAALGGTTAIDELGLKIPDDVSIVGFDGIELGQLHKPRLTTIKQDTFKIGECLGRKLLDIINGVNPEKELIVVKSKFVPGETTAKVKDKLSV